MMLDLETVKKHVRSDEFADDDEYLQTLTEAAEEHIANVTNRSINELTEMSSDGVSLPKPIQQAVLLLVGHWYNQREAVAGTQMTEAPHTLQALVKPYVKLVEE